MGTVTFKIDSELEFNRTISSLDELKIPYTFKTNKDSSFPILGQTEPYGEISILNEYESKLETILKETSTKQIFKEYNNQIKPKSKYRIWLIFLILYSIITTIYAIKYWYNNNRDLGDKNFVYEWNFDNTEFTLRHKETGIIIQRNIDTNYDLNFEKSISYSKDGSMISQAFDLNEDGFPEEVQFYNLEEKVTGRNFDGNYNGTFEYLEMTLENGDTLKLMDEDNNRIFKIQK